MKDSLDKLSRMLCSTLKSIEKAAEEYEYLGIPGLDAETQEWWEKHKELDAEREERDDKKQALQDELEALEDSGAIRRYKQVQEELKKL